MADRRRLNRRAGERVIQAGFPFVPWEESVIGLNLVRPGVDFVDAGIRDPRDPLRAGGFEDAMNTDPHADIAFDGSLFIWIDQALQVCIRILGSAWARYYSGARRSG